MILRRLDSGGWLPNMSREFSVVAAAETLALSGGWYDGAGDLLKMERI